MTPVADVARGWTSVLNRFGMGTLVLAGLAELLALPTTFGYGALGGANSNAKLIPFVVLAIVLALLIGAIAIYVGSNVVSKRFDEKNRIMRAYRVGETQNRLLAESLRDTNAKFEVAAGIQGVLIILIIFGVVAFAFDLGVFETVPEKQARSDTYAPSLLTGIFGVLGGLASHLTRRSATIGFDAIDDVLDGHEAMASISESDSSP